MDPVSRGNPDLEGGKGSLKENYILSPEALVMVQGSSKGTQPKYYDGGYWYKVNNIGYEGLAECLISKVLECSNVSDFVQYEECSVNGRSGCRSKSFTETGESFLSFQRIYEIYEGGNLTDQIRTIHTIPDRIAFTVGFVKEYTDVDCRDYLSKVLTLDMLTLNTDRHFNNLGIIVDGKNGICRPAPIFDNGNALLSDWNRFDSEEIEENLERVTGQPFAANLEMQAQAAGFGLKLDYSRLKQMLFSFPESRGLQVLKYQLNRYRNVIPEWNENGGRGKTVL